MRYLVVAHQTATSPELQRQVTRIVKEDASAEFAILVPASTHTGSQFAIDESGAREAARERAHEAAAMLEQTGATVVRTAAGSRYPYDAIADELRDRPGYEALVICTLPAGISRWLHQDLQHKAEHFGLPVIHVTAQSRVESHA